MKARALVQLNGNHRWHACSDDMRTERSGFAVAGALRSYRALPWVETRAGISLAPSQTATLRQALRAKVLVITGGPGVGKTTLVNSIIRLLGAKGTRILLAAPTNRAAKRMNEATGLEARTLHRLLEVDPRTGGFKRSEENPLEGDLLVVDEVSMVDVPLMYALLKAVPLGMALLPRRGETATSTGSTPTRLNRLCGRLSIWLPATYGSVETLGVPAVRAISEQGRALASKS
jgi:stage III sporulation protein SpoIIIAA